MPKENEQRTELLHLSSDDITLKLVVGPDYYHPAHLEVDMAELMLLLAIPWPDVYAAENRRELSDLGVRIRTAIYDWNAQFGDEDSDPAYPSVWKWLGIHASSLSATNCHGIMEPASWELNLTTDKNSFSFRLNMSDRQSRAESALRDILEIAEDGLGIEVVR